VEIREELQNTKVKILGVNNPILWQNLIMYLA